MYSSHKSIPSSLLADELSEAELPQGTVNPRDRNTTAGAPSPDGTSGRTRGWASQEAGHPAHEEFHDT